MKIFTDGSTRGKNQKGVDNDGGFAIVVMNNDETQLIDYYNYITEKTTNNRMELEALIEAMEYSKCVNEPVTIISDSAYGLGVCTQWIKGWAANNWKNSKKQTVENLDLVQHIYELISEPFFEQKIKFEKVKGHNNNFGNELADALASCDFNKLKKLDSEIKKRSI